ncbi:hypothetical protein HRG_013707 [Hirsutella rhossiliensis]
MGLTEFPDDCLPPEGQFDSRESLLASINAWAAPEAMPSPQASPRETRGPEDAQSYLPAIVEVDLGLIQAGPEAS